MNTPIPDTTNWTPRDYYKHNLPAIIAFIERKPIQFYFADESRWEDYGGNLVNDSAPYFSAPYFSAKLFRSTPEQQYIPWTQETCPRDGWIRKINLPSIYRILTIGPVGVAFGRQSYSYEGLVDVYEYSLDGRTNWIPCGELKG